MVVKHRYAGVANLATGTAGVAGTEQVWNLTGLYDPDYTSSGHQPYGYDQMAALYARYIVMEVEVECRFLSIGGTSEVMCIYNPRPPGSFTTTSGNPDTLTENPLIETKALSPSGVNRVVVIKRRFKPWDLLGISKEQYLYELSDYAGAVSSNPTIMPVLAVNVASFDGTGSETTKCQTIITYTARWYSRITQSSS